MPRGAPWVDSATAAQRLGAAGPLNGKAAVDLMEHDNAEQGAKGWPIPIEAIADAAFVHDRDYRIIGANTAYLERARCRANQALGHYYWEVFPIREGPLPGCEASMQAQAAGFAEGDVPQQARCDRIVDGSDILQSRAYPVVDEAGRYSCSLHILEDVTEREEVRKALRERDWQYHQLLAKTAEGIVIVDGDGRILYANAAAGTFLGQEPQELVGAWFGQAIPREVPQQVELFAPGIGVRTVEMGAQPIDWEGLNAWVINLHDVTNRESLRLLFQDRLARTLDALPPWAPVALVVIDVNDFRTINDSFGHVAGDAVLKQLGQRLSHVRVPAELSAAAQVSRLGGDEFAVVLPRLRSLGDAAEVARRFLEVTEAPFRVQGHEVRIHLRVGVSSYPEPAGSAAQLVQQADTAMYQARQEGVSLRFFSEELTADARERLELGSQLRQAIDEDALELHFQLQTELASGRWIGAEALLRWAHPERGWVSPAQFVPVAERVGLIGELGRWVLRRACEQARIWRDAGLAFGRVGVNVSAPQLIAGGLVQDVDYALAQAGVPPEVLALEITESVLMEQDRHVVAQLEALRARGVQIALDDFGTGYSSLSYLRGLPVDQLKIDRSFVQGLPSDQTQIKINRAIIDLGLSLGYSVLAEGIETREQQEVLLREGCPLGQGFYFARPEPAAQVTPRLCG
ncbi:putative bifunctional diguanylate cyclase/phosphodiesterase [Halorhodospira halophila]|uniref:cyclic-guanylate-specific phosphodiesterase n=1 Tax=Halorhodospira halophila (strain DSM 244 / SL1) TaxID=349124 RepID=A1WXQ7_HALHL|nr:EAL domain-containing protein [Halorhodospira halophila]ABM62469.1 diguanylate cyclase/phosphodiesterase with PAS/PAC sensor(s) [Halorhodospira halophila SL1]MBK1729598.1 GGDEF domain-containing protein [Halorhodospira halophila]